jgi:5''-nucleotidase/2'',3''-cyclic phosphodiesterase and related esterases
MEIKRTVMVSLLFLSAAALLSSAGTGAKTADILFTHDTHSQLDLEAKASLLIQAERRKNPDVFLFDAGDFSMGTLYQMLYTTDAAELRVLGMLGTDATTLGNHEFDYGSYGLYDMLESAKKSGDRVPRIVLSNADWNRSQSGARVVQQALNDYGASEYTVIEKGGVKIAVFGIFGKDALFCAPTCEVAFADPVKSAKKTVALIQAQVKPDMIVCLSHSGTNTKKSKSEDEILAEKVPGIDVIVSGHSHTTLAVPIVHGNTYIVSCGAYSANLGHMTLVQQAGGRWKAARYELLPVADTAGEDPAVREKLAAFSAGVDGRFLSRYNLHSDDVIAQNDEPLSETDVGYVMADSMRSAVEQLETASDNSTLTGTGRPVDFACVPSGLLRGTYAQGPVKVRDVFTSFSLGIGPDGLTGYPLVSIWMTGKDVKSVTELDASLSPHMDTVSLYFSGLSFTYNPHRLVFDKVESCEAVQADGSRAPVEDGRLYRCVIDLYTARMLKSVVGVTGGMVQIVPRDAQGEPVTDLNKQIVYTKSGELKGWYAIAYGIGRMGTISGYAGSRERMKQSDPSRSPSALFSHPSQFAVLVYRAAGILAVLAAAVCVLIFTVRRKRRGMKRGS